MNNNEYGKTPFYRTDDGKKEMRISDKESVSGLIEKLKESAADPDAEQIDQIRVIDEESGVTKRIIYANNNPHKNENKQTPSSIGFCIAVIAFIVGVVLFMFFAS